MENQYNLTIKSEILERQADYIFQKLFQKLGSTVSKEDLLALTAETIQRYYVNLGKPLLIQRRAEEGHLPFIENYNDSMEEIVEDISILFNEVEKIGDYLSDYFNYAQSEKMRVNQKIRGLNGLVNDLNLIANDTSENGLYFRDSFEDSTKVETSMIMGMPAQVSTGEGILTLARKSVINRSQRASIKTIAGNGSPGTFHIVRDIKTINEKGESIVASNYISDTIPNDNAGVILDGRPDTIFEYQMVNVNDSDIINVAKTYDFEYVKGKKDGDQLRLKIVVELEKPEDINWLNINPYHPTYSKGKVIVYSIRTSEDGFEYLPLYEGGNYIINSEINTTPQTYRADTIFDGSNSFTESKFAGQGVWAFPTRKAKYVEIVLDQKESYEEKIGHTYYQMVKKNADGTQIEHTPYRVSSNAVGDSIKGASPGRYAVDSNTDVIKGIEGFIGWRYAIALRDINIMSYQFEEKSELLSKRYEAPNAIREIMLYANEKIPQSYLSEISKGNDWIQYYISIDDVNWHRISPMHHQPVGENFPPKIYEINGAKLDIATTFRLHKGYIDTEKEVKGVRLKVIMQRPKDITDAESTTPILEDYALRVIMNDERI